MLNSHKCQRSICSGSLPKILVQWQLHIRCLGCFWKWNEKFSQNSITLPNKRGVLACIFLRWVSTSTFWTMNCPVYLIYLTYLSQIHHNPAYIIWICIVVTYRWLFHDEKLVVLAGSTRHMMDKRLSNHFMKIFTHSFRK